MNIVLGIDVGGSTTKIVGVRDGALIGTLRVRAADQITSLFGAIGNFLREYGIKLDDVSSVALTGVGASFVGDEPIYGITTRKVSEFIALGHGALHLSGFDEALVVSLGTGTAFIRAGKDGMAHIGGTGLGGGTIIGLASQMLGKTDIDAVLTLASDGELSNVDLSVKDIVGHEIPSLPSTLTASNFGRIKSAATEADIALGILNMVFQTAGMMAVFAARNDSIQNIVMTGMLATFPQAAQVFAPIEEMFHLTFTIPPNAVFAAAIGAAMV